MGLLDDAIREHLDLKRRTGADPGEVERAEREALGPVRRGPEPGLDQPDEQFEDPEALEPTASADEEWEDAWEDEPEHRSVPPAAEAGPIAGPPLRSDTSEAPADPAPQPGSEPEPLAHGEETAEFDVERGHERQSEEKSEDVLEETPEFLQDTPDHDRLWFEQRPPRDFDFDG